ncbi:MAG: ABC transporter permease [Calditrichaeota bacterium]|nr:ABC transporter permease [Calditrichota bacterium]MCB0269921.1 ABC transporter permease [Calditrichota bacterium]
MRITSRMVWTTGPALAMLTVFFVIPLTIIIYYSFQSRGVYGGIETAWTLENYLNIAKSLYLNILLRSLKLALLTTVFCALIGFPVAVAINNMHGKWQMTALMLIILPSWMNLLIKNYAWIVILRRQGLVNTVLLGLGWIDQPLELLFNEAAVLVGLVHNHLPFMVLPIYAVLEKLDVRLIEAARDLGATRWQTFRKVILPQSWSGVVVGSILVFVPALGAFLTPDLLGGANAVMIGNLIQNQIFTVRDWPFGSAMAIVLMGVVLLSLVVYARFGSREGEERIL